MSEKSKLYISIVDETLRDGSQGDVVMTPAFKINHVLKANKLGWADEFRVGWLSNPADQEVLNYFSQHHPDISKKILLFTLLDFGNNDNISKMFEEFCKDKRFGIASILVKGRPQDLKDIGAGVDENKSLIALKNTIEKIKATDPEKTVQIAIEHVFNSYKEGNIDFLEKTIATALISGVTKITLPDTDGAMLPSDITNTIKGLEKRLKNNKELKSHGIEFDPSIFSIHTHNDLGLGSANVMAALDSGARSAEISHNNYGERAGNASLLEVAAAIHKSDNYKCGVEFGDLPILTRFTKDLHKSLGTKLGDRTLGSEDSFNAVGGMHASHLLKAFHAMRDKDNTSIEDFITTRAYTNSYNSIPASDFDGKINVNLSSVAGKANVLFILETMGIKTLCNNGIQIDDPRINDVLKKAKEDEMNYGINYRGRENSNAKLLIAETFDLRKDASGKTNNFQINPLKNNKLEIKLQDQTIAIDLGKSESSIHLLPDKNTLVNASRIMGKISQSLESIIPELKDIHIKDIRICELEVGNAHQTKDKESGLDIVTGDKKNFSVMLILSDGKKEWRANGVNENLEQALINSIQKSIDYQIYHKEKSLAANGNTILFDNKALAAIAIKNKLNLASKLRGNTAKLQGDIKL